MGKKAQVGYWPTFSLARMNRVKEAEDEVKVNFCVIERMLIRLQQRSIALRHRRDVITLQKTDVTRLRFDHFRHGTTQSIKTHVLKIAQPEVTMNIVTSH